MTKRRNDDQIPDRALGDLPLDRLRYQLTPTIVRSVASAHQYAGMV